MRSPSQSLPSHSSISSSAGTPFDWQLTLSSDLISWPELAPVTSSGDLDWAIAFAGQLSRFAVDGALSVN